MSPGVATYKILHVLGLIYNKAVIFKLQNFSFSVNIDRCTTSNRMKMFTILVGYFDDKLEWSTLKHYKSIECIDISAKISEKTLNAFIEDNITLENLISHLSDSASYMRCEKSSIEKRFIVTNIYKFFNFQISIISCKPGSWFLWNLPLWCKQTLRLLYLILTCFANLFLTT